MLTPVSRFISFKPIALAFVISAASLSTGCGTQTVRVQGQVPVQSSHVNIVFTHRDHNMIRGYYLYNQPRHHRHIPPGHYKKRFKRHHRVPHNYPYHPLPPHLERRLTRLPYGYMHIQVGDEFAIMHTQTRVIYDVFYRFD